MTMEVPIEGPVYRCDFKQLQTAGDNPINHLVKEYGVVYVTSITRDGCSGCEEQKPLFRELAGKIGKEHPSKSKFIDVHITYRDEDYRESEQAKSAFHHASYPTYLVHVKSRLGPLEHYRAAYPTMEELEKHIVDAFELAETYQTDAAKQVTAS
jgi:hypothetical protein